MRQTRISVIVAVFWLSCVAMPASAVSVDGAEGNPLATTAGNTADGHYRLALEYLAQGNLDQAGHFFNQALDADPGMAKAMLGLAEVAFRNSDLATARTWIDNAARIASDNPHVLYSQARLQFLNRKFTDVEHLLLKALSLDPGFTKARISLGDLYLQAFQDPGKAVVAYRRALQDDADHAGAHYALGIALERLGKIPEAVKELKTAARLQADNPLPLAALGRIFLIRDPAQANGYLDRAIALDSDSASFHYLRAQAKEKTGEMEQAAEDLRKALELQPKNVPAWLRLGMLYQSRGENGKAREAYLSLLKLDPNNAVAYNNLAWMAAESGSDLDQALRWAKKARSLSPDSHAVYDTLGWVFRARGEYPQAMTTLKQAVELAPRDAGVHYHLGVVYAESGMTGDARKMLEKAITLDSSDKTATAARQLLNKL